MFRWSVTGTSFISDVMARAIVQGDGATVHAVVGRNPRTLAAFTARVPGVQTYSTLAALLDGPDVDAVYVAWPNHLHAQAVSACAQAGKAVLCEKSFSVDMDSTDAALAAVQAAGVVLMEGLMYLTHRLTAALRDVVACGELGAVRLIQGSYQADTFQFVNPAAGARSSTWGVTPRVWLTCCFRRRSGSSR